MLDGDPANLFVSFPTYDRGAMTVQGYREIVGDAVFFPFARAIQRRFAHGNISTAEFIDFAGRRSGLRGAERSLLLGRLLRPVALRREQATILPEDFS